MTNRRSLFVVGALCAALVVTPVGVGAAVPAPPTGTTPQQVSLGWLPDLLVGQFAQIQASATSGLAVSVTVSGVCRVAAPAVVVATGAGSCTVVASQPGNAQFAPATPATGTFEFGATPVTVDVRQTGVGEVVPGKALEARVAVAGIAGDIPAPTGAVHAAIRDGQGAVLAQVGARLDQAGHAWLRVPPSTTRRLAPGAYRMSVSYPGDASHLASRGREERFRVVREARATRTPSAIELGKPLVNRASHTYTFPSRPGRAVFHAWADSAQPVKASFSGDCSGVASPSGRVTVAFTDWGTCRATLWADGNAEFSASPKRVITLRARPAKTRSATRVATSVRAGQLADGGQAGAGSTVMADRAPSADPAQAPLVQVMDGDVVAIVVSGLDAEVAWQVSAAAGESVDAAWSDLGGATALDGGGILLPALAASGVGRFLLRLQSDTDGAEPRYLMVEVDAMPFEEGQSEIYDDLQLTNDDPVWKALFKWTLEGVASDIRGQIVGWAIGKLFGAEENKQEQQMREILEKLDQINLRLDQMQASINRLDTHVQQLDCKGDFNNARVSVSYIDTNRKDFQNLIRQQITDTDDWVAWAEKVVDPANSSYWALSNIALFLRDASSLGTGAITSCSRFLYQDWRDQAAAGRVLGESAYYGRLWEIIEYFYQYQVVALNMVVEANHVLATVNYKKNNGKLPPPDQMGIICQGTKERDASGPTSDPRTQCGKAKAAAIDTWNAMLDQALLAGAGFWQNPAARRSIQAQYGTSKVWVSNLRNFGSMNCPVAGNDAIDACGDAVGLGAPFSDGAGASLGYSGWTFANTKQLGDILQTRKFKDKRGYEVLAAAGFDPDQRGYIVYTGDLASGSSMYWPIYSASEGWQPLNPEVWQGRCLFDTTMRIVTDEHPMPICEGDYVHMNALAQTFKSTNWGYYFQSSWFTRGTESANQSFYETNLNRPLYPNQRYKMGIPPAGWMVGPNHPGTEQQRWPILDVGDPAVYGCSAFTFGVNRYIQVGARNATGALQMCGRDLEAFLHQTLPDPPA